MHDLGKDTIDTVRTFKSKPHINEETFFWYDGVNRILAGEWTVDCFYMNEPVNISAFWSFYCWYGLFNLKPYMKILAEKLRTIISGSADNFIQ